MCVWGQVLSAPCLIPCACIFYLTRGNKDRYWNIEINRCYTLWVQISTEVAKLPQSRFLPRPPGHDLPLRIDVPKFQPRGSVEWLRQHGLKGGYGVGMVDIGMNRLQYSGAPLLRPSKNSSKSGLEIGIFLGQRFICCTTRCSWI